MRWGCREPLPSLAAALLRTSRQAYDGRRLTAWVYTARRPKVEQPCSGRYLNVLVSGAKAAGDLHAFFTFATIINTPNHTQCAVDGE